MIEFKPSSSTVFIFIHEYFYNVLQIDLTVYSCISCLYSIFVFICELISFFWLLIDKLTVFLFVN